MSSSLNALLTAMCTVSITVSRSYSSSPSASSTASAPFAATFSFLSLTSSCWEKGLRIIAIDNKHERQVASLQHYHAFHAPWDPFYERQRLQSRSGEPFYHLWGQDQHGRSVQGKQWGDAGKEKLVRVRINAMRDGMGTFPASARACLSSLSFSSSMPR